MRTAWLDVSNGVAGDMLLAALIDAGADLEFVRREVAAVLADGVRISVADVRRGGLRAAKVELAPAPGPSQPTNWARLRSQLRQAPLDPLVQADVLRVFEALAAAEAAVHGVPADDVHFHEVGATDSIADIVGCCAALRDLRIERLYAGALALGSGRVTTDAHGALPVPVPAVLNLACGRTVEGGGEGELATPTGVALVVTLTKECTVLPRMRIARVGLGAGTADPPGRANVVRAVLGELEDTAVAPGEVSSSEQVLLEANIDDLDGRLWPTVVSDLLDAGAADAWITPIVMKKGRPAHTLHVLASPDLALPIRDLIFGRTSTFGVRLTSVERHALARTSVPVPLPDGQVRIKLALRGAVIVRAMPEFDDVLALARHTGRAATDVLDLARMAAQERGLVPGNTIPSTVDEP